MKKFYSIKVCAVIFAAVSLFTGCQNFFDGSSLKDNLNSSIKYAGAEKVYVNLELSRNVYGTLSNSGQTEFVVGYAKTLSFIANSDYNFDGWKLFNGESEVKLVKEDFSNDYIKFSSASVKSDGVRKTYSVDVTLLKAVENLRLSPSCSLIDDSTAPEFYGDFLISGTKENWENKKYLLKEYETPEKYDNSAFNRSNGLYFSFNAKEEDSDSIFLRVYEYPTLGAKDLFLDCRWSSVPLVTEYIDFKQDGSGLFTTTNEYIFHELKTETDVYVKVVFELYDASGNVCLYPVTYYAGKDTKASCEFFIESASDVAKNIDWNAPTWNKDNFVHEGDTIESLISKFSKYRVLATKESDDLYCGGKRDLLTYSYFYSIDNINFKPLELSNFEKSPDYTDNFTEYAEIDFSDADRSRGIYLKTVVTDEIGNTSSDITYIPHSADIRGLKLFNDKNLSVINNRDSTLGSFEKKFICFYCSDNSPNIQMRKYSDDTLLSVPIIEGAEEYTLLVLQGWESGKSCALVSNLSVINTKNIGGTNIPLDHTPEQFSVELESCGKNTGLFNIKVTSDSLADFENYDDVHCTYDNLFASCLGYQNGSSVIYPRDKQGYFILKNLPGEAVFYPNANLSVSGVKDNSYVFRSDEYYFRTQFNENNIPDNEPPQLSDCVKKYITSQKEILIRENQFEFNDLHNELNFTVYDRSGFALDSAGKGKVIVYYTTVQKVRTEEEIKQLKHLDLEYTEESIKKDESITNDNVNSLSKKPYSMDFTVPLYDFAETKYQLYIYVEDSSTQAEGHNYCYKEFIVNLDKVPFKISDCKPYKDGAEMKSYAMDLGTFNQGVYAVFNGSEFITFPEKNNQNNGFFNRVVFYNEDYDVYSYPIYFLAYEAECNVKNMHVYKNNYTIMYDQPCLVETVWSEKNWGDDDEFSPARWIYHTPESHKVGRTMLFPNGGELGTGTMCNYNVEEEAYKFYYEEGYYCVIVHFADGTTMMSPVRPIQ